MIELDAGTLALIRADASERAPPALAPLLDEIAESAGDPRFPGAVLPRIEDGRLVFYAAAPSEPVWRQLQPLLLATVGVTRSTFRGRPDHPADDPPRARALRAAGRALLARFEADVASGERARDAASALVRLRRQLGRAPAGGRELSRPTERVLAEFDRALTAGDRERAEEAIAFLRANLRLDALNLRFLEVKLDRRFADWARLRARPYFRDLTAVRRPPPVTLALAEAIAWTVTPPFAAAHDPARALAAFRAEAASFSPALFATVPPNLTPAAGTAFLLAALASPEQDVARITALRRQAEEWRPDEAGFFFEVLALSAPAPVPSPPSAVVDVLTEAADPERPPDVDLARAAVDAAIDAETLEAARIALAYVARLAPEQASELRAQRRMQLLLPELERLCAPAAPPDQPPAVPGSWQEWLLALPALPLARARELAERAATEWRIAEQVPDAGAVAALAAALDEAASHVATQPILFDCLPHLVDWARADPYWPNRTYLPLYRELALILMLGSGGAPDALQALAVVLDGMLTVGLEPTEYRTVLGDLAGIVPGLAGPRTLDWLLDLVDLTAGAPCPDLEARLTFWRQVYAALSPHAARLSAAQRGLVRLLARSFGDEALIDGLFGDASAPLSAAVEAGRRVPRAGFVVALYTLTESAGQRVRSVLTQLYAGLRVELSHDRVATPRLEALARNADLFVICWSSAKHAATSFIKQCRPPNRPLLQPPGAGSSSVLRAVQAELDRLV